MQSPSAAPGTPLSPKHSTNSEVSSQMVIKGVSTATSKTVPSSPRSLLDIPVIQAHESVKMTLPKPRSNKISNNKKSDNKNKSSNTKKVSTMTNASFYKALYSSSNKVNQEKDNDKNTASQVSTIPVVKENKKTTTLTTMQQSQPQNVVEDRHDASPLVSKRGDFRDFAPPVLLIPKVLPPMTPTPNVNESDSDLQILELISSDSTDNVDKTTTTTKKVSTPTPSTRHQKFERLKALKLVQPKESSSQVVFAKWRTLRLTQKMERAKIETKSIQSKTTPPLQADSKQSLQRKALNLAAKYQARKLEKQFVSAKQWMEKEQSYHVEVDAPPVSSSPVLFRSVVPTRVFYPDARTSTPVTNHRRTVPREYSM